MPTATNDYAAIHGDTALINYGEKSISMPRGDSRGSVAIGFFNYPSESFGIPDDAIVNSIKISADIRQTRGDNVLYKHKMWINKLYVMNNSIQFSTTESTINTLISNGSLSVTALINDWESGQFGSDFVNKSNTVNVNISGKNLNNGLLLYIGSHYDGTLSCTCYMKNVKATITYIYQDKINKIYVGGSLIKDIYIGNDKIKSVYVGTTKIYG